MAVRQYIGARYVTKIYENSLDPSSAEWEADVTYEPLTLVTFNNSSYLSKKDVPGSVGNPAANPFFWVVTGAYNGQIMQLQNDIAALQAVVDGRVATPEDYGAAGDGVTDDTTALNDCFQDPDAYIIVGKPGAVYLVDGEISLKPISNKIIDLNGSTLKVKPTASAGFYSAITIDNVDNIIIKNGTIIGDRDGHLGTTGEHGMGIYTINSPSNIVLENLDISKCWGDSICLDEGDFVTVRSCNLHNSRRMGLTVGNCTDVIIDGNSIHDISGTDPQAGIDIEPDFGDVATNVIVTNNIIKNCVRAFNADAGTNYDGIVNLQIENNTFIANNAAQAIINLKGNYILFKGNSVLGSTAKQVLILNGTGLSIDDNYFKVTLTTNTNIVLCALFVKGSFSGNTLIDCVGYNLISCDGSENSSFVGNIVNNCTIGSCLMYFRAPDGEASKNIIANNEFKDVTSQYAFGFAQHGGNNVFTYNNVLGTYEYFIIGVASVSGNKFYLNNITDGTSGTHTGTAYGEMHENFIDGTLVA